MISLGRLIKAIFLFEDLKSVFLVINRIKRLRLLTVRFFKEKIFKNHILRTSCQMCHVGQGSEYHVTEHVTEHV